MICCLHIEIIWNFNQVTITNQVVNKFVDLLCKCIVDRPAVAASLNKELAWIQEWCNHCCMILNLNKIKALVVSRSRTMSHPHGDLVLSGVSIRASPNLDILGVKFDSKLTFEDYVRGIISRVSQIICILRLVKRIFVGTSVLLRCYFAFVLPILEHSSPVYGSAAACHLQFLERQVYSVTRLCYAQSFLSLHLGRRVSELSMLYKVNSNSNHCLFSELPSASTSVRNPELRPQQLIHWSSKYRGAERPNLLGLSCRLMF